MRFSKHLLSIFLLLTFAEMSAQDEAAILKSVSRLYDANYYMEFDQIPDLTYPKVVEQLGGKQQFLVKLDKDFQNEKFRKRLQLTAPVFQVEPIKKLNSKTFCVIIYRNPTRYFYEQKLSEGEMNKEIESWKKVAGTKEVFPEPNRNSINVKRISKFVAVKDASTANDWKFFNLDDLEQAEVFNAVFAQEKSQLGL